MSSSVYLPTTFRQPYAPRVAATKMMPGTQTWRSGVAQPARVPAPPTDDVLNPSLIVSEIVMRARNGLPASGQGKSAFVLQVVNDAFAKCGIPPLQISFRRMEPGHHASFNPQSWGIEVNTDEQGIEELVDSICHESRHALQHFWMGQLLGNAVDAVNVAGLRPDVAQNAAHRPLPPRTEQEAQAQEFLQSVKQQRNLYALASAVMSSDLTGFADPHAGASERVQLALATLEPLLPAQQAPLPRVLVGPVAEGAVYEPSSDTIWIDDTLCEPNYLTPPQVFAERMFSLIAAPLLIARMRWLERQADIAGRCGQLDRLTSLTSQMRAAEASLRSPQQRARLVENALRTLPDVAYATYRHDIIEEDAFAFGHAALAELRRRARIVKAPPQPQRAWPLAVVPYSPTTTTWVLPPMPPVSSRPSWPTRSVLPTWTPCPWQI